MKNVAVIGYGGQGAWHCSQILNSDVVRLAGIYDINESRCKMASDNGIFVYDSDEAVFDDESVDIIVVATPNDVHEELVIKGLLSGHNVICEKPVALSVESFDRMCATAEKSGKKFSVHQNRRWDVDFLAMKSIIESNEIGEVFRIESRVHGSRGIPSDWRCQKQYGGGMILDWGVHLIDQMLQLITEKIVGIDCFVTHYTNCEVDDGFKLELEFESGKTALVEVGTYNFLPLPRFYMQCKKGSAVIDDWQKNTKIARLKAWNEKEVLPVQTASGITKTMAPRDEITLDVYEFLRPVSDVHDFYRNYCNAIEGIEPMAITQSQVRRVLWVMEEAFNSFSERKRAKVDI